MSFSRIFNAGKTVYRRSMHLDLSPNKKISKQIWNRYKKLKSSNCKFQLTYVWIGGNRANVHAKTRSVDYSPASHEDCPKASFNGSGTNLAQIENSDVILCPVALYEDPITRGKMVLCETYSNDGSPTPSNYRNSCMKTLNKNCCNEPMFTFEQEFLLMDVNNRPFGWPHPMGEYSHQGSYYCSVGADKAFGRAIIECFYRCCLYAGVDISGANPERVPSQWEALIGPSIGIKAADDLWMARYLLKRVSEDFGVAVSFQPKFLPDWAGNGCHTNFSTKQMREEGGYKFIEEAVKKLGMNHDKVLKEYDIREGKCNKVRLNGKHGASVYERFTSGIGNRTSSVRISRSTAGQQKGYLQDRRPSGCADPYQVMKAMVNTICTD